MEPVTPDANGFTMLLEYVLFSDHKDIFMRELICNGLDALSRLKLNHLKSENPRIEIIAKHYERTLIIKDNGIGMTKDDLQSYLGQICQSGTKKFVQIAHADPGLDWDVAEGIIGCRGIGFRSTYPVAETITITSKHIDGKHQLHDVYTMTFSDDKTSFSIQQNKESTGVEPHGTQITLNLKRNASEYATEIFIRNTVTKYFKLIPVPIYFAYDDLEFELLNPYWDALAMQQVMNSSIKTTEMGAKAFDLFYNYICNDIEHEFDPKTLIYGYIRRECVADIPTSIVSMITSFYPLDCTEFMFKKRFFVEGQLEFGVCLFVANDFEYKYGERKTNRCQLYIKNMFIEYCDDILPKCLDFMKAVIQSHDLPLNWSKTAVTNAKIYRLISRNIYKKALQSMLDFAKNEKEKYEQIFYPLYCKNLKLLTATAGGLIGTHTKYKYDYKPENVMELLRFKTTKSDNAWISLQQLLITTKQGQRNIYYAFPNNSQHLDKYKQLDIEVVLFDDEVHDQYVIQAWNQYMIDMPFKCISS